MRVLARERPGFINKEAPWGEKGVSGEGLVDGL